MTKSEAHKLAMLVLQSDLYQRPDIKEATDNILAATTAPAPVNMPYERDLRGETDEVAPTRKAVAGAASEEHCTCDPPTISDRVFECAYCRRKPDSASAYADETADRSAGSLERDVLPRFLELKHYYERTQQSWSDFDHAEAVLRKHIAAATPSGGGQEKWRKLTDFPMTVITENGAYVGGAQNEADADNFIRAHNATLQPRDISWVDDNGVKCGYLGKVKYYRCDEDSAVVKAAVESGLLHPLQSRDCGNDTKRLDWLGRVYLQSEWNGIFVDMVSHKLSVRAAIDAAMKSQT